MRRTTRAILLVVALLLLAPMESLAGGHGWRGHGGYGHGWRGHGYYAPRVTIGLGSAFWWGARPGWWYGAPPAYVYSTPVYVAPRRVIVEEPPVYIQRGSAPSLPPSYWYYCESAGGYYPRVPTCPEPWVQVLPRTE